MRTLLWISAFAGMTMVGVWVAALRAEPAPADIFQKANEAYQAGDVAQARDFYEQLLAQGLESFPLYYDLGNAYYRLGRLGKSRLWYERARRLDPGDEDVRYNLKMIRAQIQEGADSPLGFLESASGWLGWFLLAANLLFFSALAAGLFREAEWLWWARWAAGIVFVTVLGIFIAAKVQGRAPAGIVLEPRAEVRTGPGEDSRVGFVVPEGQKVVLFNAVDGWRQIGVPEKGLRGWVRQDAAEPIALHP